HGRGPAGAGERGAAGGVMRRTSNVQRPTKGRNGSCLRWTLDVGRWTLDVWGESLYLRREDHMSGVRVLVGTRKGAFVLTSDGRRQRWDVSGPHFAGWEIYHMKGS